MLDNAGGEPLDFRDVWHGCERWRIREGFSVVGRFELRYLRYLVYAVDVQGVRVQSGTLMQARFADVHHDRLELMKWY